MEYQKHILRDYNDFLGGKGWKWYDDLTIDTPNKQSLFLSW